MNNLEDIKNRLAAATPGPWRTWKDNDGRRGSAVETTWAHDTDGADTELITDWCSPADADLIAHAPEDIARLVKALEAVLGHHEPVMEDGEPVGCYNCDWESGGNEAWPCATVRAINDALA